MSSLAETSALSAALLSESALDRLIEQVHPRAFAEPMHRKVYEAMITLRNADEDVNSVTVGEFVGSHGDIAMIDTAFGDPGSIDSYCKLILADQTRRDLNKIALHITESGRVNTEDLVGQVEAMVQNLRPSSAQAGMVPASEWARRSLEYIEDAGDQQAFDTGLVDLDTMCRWLPGNVITLAARPGMGKSAFAGHVCSVNPKNRVGFFSYEMSTMELAARMYAAQTSIDGFRIRDGRLTDKDWRRLIDAGRDMAEWNLYFDDDTSADWPALAAKIRRFCQEERTHLVVIDYLQLLNYPAYAAGGRNAEVGAISRGVKLLAKQCNVPILALSQLNRESARGGQVRRPVLTDLRDSGAIEQDADMVLFLHRESTEPPAGPTPVEIVVAKNRNGSVGTTRAVWFPATFSFRQQVRR